MYFCIEIYEIFIVFIVLLCDQLSSGNNRDLGLDKVVLHESLQVKVGQLVTSVQLEQCRQTLVGVDDATIGTVLQVIAADVVIDLLADGCASHLCANSLAQKLGELVANTGGLDKAGRLAVSRALGLLRAQLLSSLELTGNSLLKSLEVVLQAREETKSLLDLGRKLGKLESNCRRGINGLNHLVRKRDFLRGGSGGSGGNCCLLSSGLLGGSGLLCLASGSRGSGGGASGGLGSHRSACLLCSSYHSCFYTV